MWVIRKEADLQALREEGMLPNDMLEMVEQYFVELKDAGILDDAVGEVNVLDECHIVVIDPLKDDWRAILEVDQAIWIEYVELLTLDGGSQVFRVGRMMMEDVL